MIVCLPMRTWGVWWWFLALQLMVKAEVTLENGAYRNIVVSFSSNLPGGEGGNIVQQTRDLLKETSSALNRILGVSIAQVTYVLPDDWDVSGYATEVVSAVEPDIVVEGREGSPFGKRPSARQFGGCGVRGTHIDVPYSFLTSEEETYPKGKLMAREWLKFRYGVFDEHGFRGDSRYPDHYTVPGDDENVQITECTDPAVEYIIKNLDNETCSLGEENCEIHLREEAEVKSSLMYLHEQLENVEKVCGKEHPHNFMSPSKQNILCNEKSIWDVLNESGEFKDEEPTENSFPEYSEKFVKVSKPKMLILLEATSLLQSKKEEIIFALRRVLYDLPDGTHLGLKTFLPLKINEVRKLSELGEDRRLLMSTTFESPANGVCPLCALQTAVDDFAKNHAENEPGLLVLITASNNPNEDIRAALLEKLKNSHLFLQLITITDEGDSLNGYSTLLGELEHLNKGHLSEIKSSSKIDFFKALYTHVLSHFPFSPTDQLIEVVNNEVIKEHDTITISETHSNITIWADSFIEEGQLVCVNENGNNVSLHVSPSNEGIGRVTYSNEEGSVTCTLEYGTKMVQVTKPKPVSEYVLSTSTWIHDTTPKELMHQANSKVQMPVIIYANINYGSYPVFGATVKAVVRDEDGEGVDVVLKDDGAGDPDITMGDGIYSGYFFQFNKAGFYNVKVQIRTDEYKTKAIKIGNDRCCGAEVKPAEPIEESTIKVPNFVETASTVFFAISSRPDAYPPAKILDLRVKKFEPPSLLELSWTAPGEEMHQGNAARYTLKSFTDRTEALQSFESAGQDLGITMKPSSPGTTEVLSLQLDGLLDDNMTHYLSIRAEGPLLPGQPSNVVTVSVPEAGDPTEPPQPTEDPHLKKALGPDSNTIAIVIGVLVGVIVVCVCLYLAIYCYGKKKRKAKEEEVRKAEEGSAARNGGTMGMNSIPADVILRHHSEVVKAKRDHKDPPIFTEEDAASDGKQDDYSQVQKDRPPELPASQPPKSPKRMTVV